MTQTMGAMNGVNCQIELEVASVWEDISGSANQVGNPEQRRMSGEAYTFSGDVAILGAGKREPVEVTFRILFTEDAGESWELVREHFEENTRASIRWQPDPDVGSLIHTITKGIITRFTYPAADAAEPAPIQCEFTIRAAQIVSA